MSNSEASLETGDTVLSISETVETDHEEANHKKKLVEADEEEEEENTDCKVYITTGLLVVLCLVVVFGKVRCRWLGWTQITQIKCRWKEDQHMLFIEFPSNPMLHK